MSEGIKIITIQEWVEAPQVTEAKRLLEELQFLSSAFWETGNEERQRGYSERMMWILDRIPRLMEEVITRTSLED